MKQTIPPQSLQARVTFPGITRAARELRVSRGHLFAVLNGDRESARLKERWRAWLQRNPQIAELY